MASSASLKRRLSGGQTRNDGSSPVGQGADPGFPSSSRTRTPPGKARQARHPVEQAREIRRSSAELRLADSAALTPDTAKVAKSIANKSSSWGWAQRTWSFLAPEADQTSPPAQGFEAFNVVKRAADGIASTATAMATSLDTTVEQIFEGWTPAPAASDHNTPFRHHPCKYNRKSAAQQAQLKQTPESSRADTTQAAACDGWDDWGSSFGSRSPSPDMIPKQQDAASPAWPAADGSAQEPEQQRRRQQQQLQSSVTISRSSAAEQCSERQEASSHDKQPACPLSHEHADLAAGGAAETGRQPCREGASTPGSSSHSRQHYDVSPWHALTNNLSSSPSATNLHSQQAQSEAASPERDPLADQMAGQLQALLAEKACLAQENDRLARENNGLQELLQYTMHQHLPDPVEGLDEWATLESALPEGGPIPSVENGSPLISPR